MPVLDSILLVDDDVTANFLHRRLLSRLQVAANIDVAINGAEALRYLQLHCIENNSGNNRCPKLIFLDIKMPIMDGIEFMEHYEKMKSRPDCKIIVLSSSVNPKDTERLQKFESVQHQYVKPLSENIVQQIINQYFST